MNERNVAALAHLLEVMPGPPAGAPEAIRRDFWRMMAESLARDGVLVPAALTRADSEAVVRSTGFIIADEGPISRVEWTHLANVPAALERLAKGEPA